MNIKTLAKKFNETHSRAMTYAEAEDILTQQQGIYYPKHHAELYAESVRLEEEKKHLRWKQEALIVMGSWDKVSEFITENNLAGLGDQYSKKCLEILQKWHEERKILESLKPTP